MFDSEDPRPSRQERRGGPKPWPGCDTNSEAWRAYCEAFEHAFTRKDPRLRHLIYERRGKAALEFLDRCIEVVRRDYRGEIDDRTALPALLA